MVEIILKRTFAFIDVSEWAGMIMAWPVSSMVDSSLMIISAVPSITWTKVSKREIFSLSTSPESNEITLTFPVVFFIIVFITTELGMYSMISTIIKDFA